VMSTRAHIPPNRKWANLEHQFFHLEPPAHGPFHGLFRFWANSQRCEKRGQKIRCKAIGRQTTQTKEADKGHDTRQSCNGSGGWG
jgi:hypothetical protein